MKRHMHAVCRKFAFCLLVEQSICGPGSFSRTRFSPNPGGGECGDELLYCIFATGTHAAIRLVVHLVLVNAILSCPYSTSSPCHAMLSVD